jgi:hypothetical protein
MTDVSILSALIADDPRAYAELGASCGSFIDTWLAAGGEPTDDAVLGFYSIWSQSLDVPGGATDAKEQAAFYEWAYPHFIRSRDGVAASLMRAPGES